MKRICVTTIVAAASFIADPIAFAAPPKVLTDACNALKDQSKRRECLAALVEPSRPPTAPPPPAVKEKSFAETVAEPAKQCARILAMFKSWDKDAVVEEDLDSTSQMLRLKWKATEPDKYFGCTFDKSLVTVLSIRNAAGREITGNDLQQVNARAIQREETDAGNYSNVVKSRKAMITRQLKDPSSAQYRELFISGKAMLVLCGEINAKNSYGAYIGFKRFYATDLSELSSIEPAGRDPSDAHVFRNMWPKMCGEKIADYTE